MSWAHRCVLIRLGLIHFDFHYSMHESDRFIIGTLAIMSIFTLRTDQAACIVAVHYLVSPQCPLGHSR